MIPFFVDIFVEPAESPLLGRRIAALGMGYPDESNDLEVEVVLPGDYGGEEDPDRAMALTFRNRVMKTGGTAIGRARAPMLGVQLAGWDVRAKTWPRLAFELLRARAPLYNFATPLSRKWNDCDMADLRMIVSQGSYLPDGNDMDFSSFLSFMRGPDKSVSEYFPAMEQDVRALMERRIYLTAETYGDYVEFSGKE